MDTLNSLWFSRLSAQVFFLRLLHFLRGSESLIKKNQLKLGKSFYILIKSSNNVKLRCNVNINISLKEFSVSLDLIEFFNSYNF